MQAFDRVMEAYKLPRNTPDEVGKRKAAIENALKGACSVALSDAGVSGLLLRAAVEGAGYNVLINLAGIADEEFKSEILREYGRIVRESGEIWSRIKSTVEPGVAR